MKNIINKLFVATLCGFSIIACKNDKQEQSLGKEEMETQGTLHLPDSAKFSTTINEKEVNLYAIKNENGIEAYFTNYGARLVSLIVPNMDGQKTDVVIGLESAEAYQQSSEPYFGATIGRFGNRIAKGKFSLNGKDYSIAPNNGPNALHGGKGGFQDVVWEVSKLNDYTLIFEYLSKDMEEGFPGNLEVQVIYSLTAENELKMEYKATTDKTTVVNLTNHAFFNLNGEGSGSILNHSLQIKASKFTPVDEGLIPTGELKDVAGTPFDFTQPHSIGERINSDNEQLKNGKGYDHNFVLDGEKSRGMTYAARVVGDESGIVMDIYTQEPGIQFYSGNFMESKNVLKTGAKDDFRTAFALETQHFPDAPNQPNFPSTILEPGETYTTTSIYAFGIDTAKKTQK